MGFGGDSRIPVRSFFPPFPTYEAVNVFFDVRL
jgi:hypothetical protein